MTLLGVTTAAPSASAQLHTLTAPAGPRFTITDRVWPTNVGEADIALWKDDKLAAASFTIDDNIQPDHAWWIDRGNEYGWNFTWFVITDLVGGGNPTFGTWSDFAALRAQGHAVQSHATTGTLPIPAATSYPDSIQAIETNLPGNKVTSFAYPFGSHAAGNDTALAAVEFNAARGVVGLINDANTINYNDTKSINTRNLTAAPWTDVQNLLNPGGYNGGQNYRGWYVSHSHSLLAAEKTEVIAHMDYLKAHEDDIWVGLFQDVAFYGMERDTATLTTLDGGDGSYTLTLTDQMDDADFQAALTVKLHVPTNWSAATVTQNGVATSADIVTNNGQTFALVPVTPDLGDAVVTAAGIVGDFNASRQIEQGDLDLVLLNWGVDTDTAGIPAGWTNDNNNLGLIDQAELDRVLLNWGTTAEPGLNGSAVPEPAAAFALLLGMSAAGPMRRRQR